MGQTDWYKHVWTLSIKNQPWTENTGHQVDFIIKVLGLKGDERILDLACGYGRHAIMFAQRGYSVTGVDITKEYIEDAQKTVQELSLDATFYHADIRDVAFQNEFDVVLNLDDGAIGYLENDEENLKIFDVISRALKSGGKHFMGVNNAEYAERYFPTTECEIGEKMLTIWAYDWDDQTRLMKLDGSNIRYGEIAKKPNIDMENANPIRLYSVADIEKIFQQRDMRVVASYANYTEKEASSKELVLNVYSVKQ